MIATNTTAQAEMKAVILGFNKRLSVKVEEFQLTHPDVSSCLSQHTKIKQLIELI